MQVIVIGGGASGLMAAARAAECGATVLLLEKMERPGKKVLISGKARCNLTNTRPLDDFLTMYGNNGRFLRSVFHRFFREELLALLQRYGLETKAERGGRVFPVSDDANDVVLALERYRQSSSAQLRTSEKVTAIVADEGAVRGVQTETGFYRADAVILAAGGSSFPGTGSSGDGYHLAAALGHTIVPLRPALVPLAVQEAELAKSMQGVALKNVRLSAYQLPVEAIPPTSPAADAGGRGAGRKRAQPPLIESRLGEMMFTHFGIGGPITLLMSLAVVDALASGPVSVAIDLKPGLDEKQLRQRLLRDFDTYGKRGMAHILDGLLPRKLVEPFLALSAIPGDKPGHQISTAERERLLELLKSLRFNIARPLPLSTAIVTAGGVSLKEIDPQTLQSRLVRGLYCCGEVLDLDADTGGYNLQAAFSTGYIAGEAAAMSTSKL